MSYYVYILVCTDGSFYTGSTNDVAKRIKNHLDGRGARYTKSHKPQKLIYQEKFSTKSDALKREAEIKSWTRAKKEELITAGHVQNINI
ncbi:MAG: GIY-YIG nuclease family protein [Candidatus Woesebacteria bacterium]|nr:GIY-YIG nuclease family protein [Candidatus Woesebacteria bacterium]